jgi:murein tripeptide amidase MpaA
VTFDRYYQHDEINLYLDNLQKNSLENPQVRMKTVGKSYEGREIKTVTITNGDGRAKNSIFIDAGIHAR